MLVVLLWINRPHCYLSEFVGYRCHHSFETHVYKRISKNMFRHVTFDIASSKLYIQAALSSYKIVGHGYVDERCDLVLDLYYILRPVWWWEIEFLTDIWCGITWKWYTIWTLSPNFLGGFIFQFCTLIDGRSCNDPGLVSKSLIYVPSILREYKSILIFIDFYRVPQNWNSRHLPYEIFKIGLDFFKADNM